MIRAVRGVAAATALALVLTGGTAAAQKAGGTLRIYNTDSPPGLNIYEQATPNGQGPLMAVYNNLILFDQHDPQVRLESIKPDLATKWEWNEEGTALTFTLRPGVKWHDGQPFTARDVLCAIDLRLDKAKDKVRFNPGKSTLKNLESVTADNDYQVTFHLKRPQPAFPTLLAGGFDPGPDAAASDRYRAVQICRVQAQRIHQADAQSGLLETGPPLS
jgi:peptide/nickel transport system substrate-binding protein